MNIRGISIALAAVALAVSSCGKPQEGYAFMDRAPYTFDVPLDSGAVYSIYMACIISPGEYEHNTLDVVVNVASPSDERFREEVTLPVYSIHNYPKNNNIRISKAGRYNEMEWLYRSNITTSEGGMWKVTVQPQTSFMDGLYGIGLRYNIISGNERKR